MKQNTRYNSNEENIFCFFGLSVMSWTVFWNGKAERNGTPKGFSKIINNIFSFAWYWERPCATQRNAPIEIIVSE